MTLAEAESTACSLLPHWWQSCSLQRASCSAATRRVSARKPAQCLCPEVPEGGVTPCVGPAAAPLLCGSTQKQPWHNPALFGVGGPCLCSLRHWIAPAVVRCSQRALLSHGVAPSVHPSILVWAFGGALVATAGPASRSWSERAPGQVWGPISMGGAGGGGGPICNLKTH